MCSSVRPWSLSRPRVLGSLQANKTSHTQAVGPGLSDSRGAHAHRGSLEKPLPHPVLHRPGRPHPVFLDTQSSANQPATHPISKSARQSVSQSATLQYSVSHSATQLATQPATQPATQSASSQTFSSARSSGMVSRSQCGGAGGQVVLSPESRLNHVCTGVILLYSCNTP